MPRMHNMVVNQSEMKAGRQVKVHSIAGFPEVHIDTILGWWRQKREEKWNEMIDDADLQKSLGADWWKSRGRVPGLLCTKLNEALVAEGKESRFKKSGRPSHLDKMPELVGWLKEADKRGACLEGFRKTLKSVVGLKNAELADQEQSKSPSPSSRVIG